MELGFNTVFADLYQRDGLVRLAREIPVWQLDFRPDRGIWHELTREAA